MKLKGLFKSIPIYVLLYKNRIKIYRLDTGKYIEKETTKPFSNSRLLLGNFQRFEVFLKDLLKQLFKEEKYILGPIFSMLLHQIEMKEDGVTEVEKRALVDSAKHSNAKESYLYFGDDELSLTEALNRINNKKGSYSITQKNI